MCERHSRTESQRHCSQPSDAMPGMAHDHSAMKHSGVRATSALLMSRSCETNCVTAERLNASRRVVPQVTVVRSSAVVLGTTAEFLAPDFTAVWGLDSGPPAPTCTCCVYLHPSHLRFPLRCPLTDTLTLADGTPESSQRTMYSSTSPASAHTHTWQVMCRMKTQKWRTAPYRHLIASEKIIVKHARRQKRKRSSHITYQPSSFRSGISCRCSGRSSPIGADSRPLPRLASSRHPRRLRGKTSS